MHGQKTVIPFRITRLSEAEQIETLILFISADRSMAGYRRKRDIGRIHGELTG